MGVGRGFITVAYSESFGYFESWPLQRRRRLRR